MKKRLTLTIDEECIKNAKAYSKLKGKSVSKLVENYFTVMGQPIKPRRKEDLPPAVRSLAGILEGLDIKNYREEYRKHLEEKYL